MTSTVGERRGAGGWFGAPWHASRRCHCAAPVLAIVAIASLLGCGGGIRLVGPIVERPTDSAPAWSPNGFRLAYVHFSPQLSDTTEPSGLYVVDTTGEHRELLARGFPRTVDWSPDGNALVFDDAAGLHVLALADGTVRTIYDGGSFPTWSPDGSVIAFDTNRRIWLISPAGGTPRQAADAFPVRMPDWSPDGTRLVVVDYSNAFGELAVIRLADGATHDITHDSRFDEYPSWSPDNMHIAWNHWSQSADGSNLPEVWVADSNGVGARMISVSPAKPGWSPDGKRIALSMATNGAVRVFTVALDGSGLRQVTH